MIDFQPQMLQPPISPSTLAAVLSAGSACAGGNDVILIKTSTASVRSFFEHRAHAMIAQAFDVATLAANEAFPLGGFQVTEERPAEPERVADTLVVVQAPGLADVEHEISAEQTFYTAVVRKLPPSMTPVVAVLLRF